MNKNEIINNVLTKLLGNRISILEKNSLVHFEVIKSAFQSQETAIKLSEAYFEKMDINSSKLSNDKSFSSNVNKSLILNQQKATKPNSQLKLRKSANENKQLALTKSIKNFPTETTARNRSKSVNNEKREKLKASKSSLNLIREKSKEKDKLKSHRELTRHTSNADLSPMGKSKRPAIAIPSGGSKTPRHSVYKPGGGTKSKEPTAENSKLAIKGINSISHNTTANKLPSSKPTSKSITEFDKDLNVSRIIALEQNTHDDLIMNNKDDQYLLTSVLHEIDYNLGNNNNNQTPNKFCMKKEVDLKTSGKKEQKIEIEEILEDRWMLFSKYLNHNDLAAMGVVSRKFLKLAYQQMAILLETEKKEYEEKIKNFKLSPEEVAKSADSSVFQFSKGSLKAIELLNEARMNKIFTEAAVPNDDILLVYRLYFQLIKHPLSREWKKNLFWLKLCQYILNESYGKIGTLVSNSLLNNLSSSPENIIFVLRLLKNNLFKITPAYFSKMCGTTGLVVFFIKDVLDYLGISGDKKLVIRSYRLFTEMAGFLEKRIELMKKYQE